ncbi:phosphotransferase [Rhodococcus sp. 4CII]|uniref:phosphotransferase n=1 Tax=Rhodococcus sp. 4CII TaxID=2834580 RepID=UPI00163D6A5A|nr:phosphotransferase [Rhodococcus sp. 4CII]MBC2898426.1 phosphotransferase [Rhodococcus sp. 4CII]
MTPFTPVVSVDVISPEWLTHMLSSAGVLQSGRVVAVDRQSCGTGQLADSYRFTLTYDPVASGPATVVGKFPSADATSREYGRQSGFYRSEIRFYQELAPDLPIARPHPFHAALADNDTDFVLMMEDLAPARTVDQLVGCTADEASLVLEQAARLHATSWKNPALTSKPWLQATVDQFVKATDGFPSIVSAFPEEVGDLASEADLQEAAKLNDHIETWKEVFSEPRCLWHNDFRADNMLFAVNGDARPVTVLDWQGVGIGCGTIDIAYFLGGSLTTEQRRIHEHALVRHYHENLVAFGVTDYTLEQCWDDYRVMAIHGLQVGVYGAGAVKRTPRGDEMWRTWIRRHATQTRDLDSFTALARR